MARTERPQALEGKTAVVYMRTSSRGQKERATIKMQTTVTDRLVKEHGVTVLATIKDDGISGRLLEGRDFKAFIDSVRAGTLRLDYLIVYSASRLSRVDMFNEDSEKQIQSEMDEALINATLRSHGVKVIDPEGIHDDLRPANIHSSKEIRDFRRRSMDGKARRLSENKAALGGKAPFGYRPILADPDDRKSGWTYEPHAVDAPNLRQLFIWFCEGGYSHASHLATQNKFPMAKRNQKNRKDKSVWDPMTVFGLVKARGIYLGHRTLIIDREPHTITYPPIIDLDLFAAVERKTKEHAIKRRAAFLGTGFLICGCGAHIAQHQSSKYNYSRCTVKGCGSEREEVVSGALWVSVLARVTTYTLAKDEEPKSATDYDAPIKDVTFRIAKATTAQDNLADLVADGMPKEVWRRKNDELNVTKSQLQAELARLKAGRENDAKRVHHDTDMRAKAASQLRAWKKTPPSLEEKRRALADVLNGGRAIVRFKPRLSIELPPWGATVTASEADIGNAVTLLTADGPDGVGWHHGHQASAVPSAPTYQLKEPDPLT